MKNDKVDFSRFKARKKQKTTSTEELQACIQKMLDHQKAMAKFNPKEFQMNSPEIEPANNVLQFKSR